MVPRRPQPPLEVILLGRMAAKGLQLLKSHLKTPCALRAFPVAQEDHLPLEELAGTQVVVGNYFTERMARAAPNLRLLQAVGAGVDEFCMDRLSPYTSVANVYFHGPAIGEYVVMMMLALSRNLLKLDTEFRKGSWEGSWIWGDPPPEEIRGKVLGLVGYGHIGREVASRARAFGMKIWIVSGHVPARKPKSVAFWQGPRGLRSLLKEADFLVLACPLNPKTRGLIAAREFTLMKPGAFLINVARGPVVDEAALYHALRERRIQGAALDVWYRYPTDQTPCEPSQFPFHELDSVIMTPHVSGWMRGTRERRFQAIAENIDRLASGRPLRNVLRGPRQQKSIFSA